ncbi:MAG: TraR/DksA family transcriptional regulator [Alphaproteobacteria bacterium]|jgi:RNA polymerase-binding transcription factor DksA
MHDIAKVRASLEQRLKELDERSEEIDDELSEAPDPDWSENAAESENDEVLEGVGNLALAEIRDIKLALSRIDAGTYGECTKCGEMIDPKRLAAVPYATKCIKCA